MHRLFGRFTSFQIFLRKRLERNRPEVLIEPGQKEEPIDEARFKDSWSIVRETSRKEIGIPLDTCLSFWARVPGFREEDGVEEMAKAIRDGRGPVPAYSLKVDETRTVVEYISHALRNRSN